MIRRKATVDVPGLGPEQLTLWIWQDIDEDGYVYVKPSWIAAAFAGVVLLVLMPNPMLGLTLIRIVAIVGTPLLLLVVIASAKHGYPPWLRPASLVVGACLFISALTMTVG